MRGETLEVALYCVVLRGETLEVGKIQFKPFTHGTTPCGGRVWGDLCAKERQSVSRVNFTQFQVNEVHRSTQVVLYLTPVPYVPLIVHMVCITDGTHGTTGTVPHNCVACVTVVVLMVQGRGLLDGR